MTPDTTEGVDLTATVARDQFVPAVQWIARVAAARPLVPADSVMVLRGDGGSLHLAVRSSGAAAATDITATNGTGSAHVPVRMLAEATRLLPPAEIELAVDAAGRLRLDCADVSYRIPTVAGHPATGAVAASPGAVRVAADAFALAVRRVAIAAGRDALLPTFTGIRLRVGATTLRMTATDRYRMSTAVVPCSRSATGPEVRCLVPTDVLREVARHSCHGDVVHLDLADPSTTTFAGIGPGGEPRHTTIALLDGGFPDEQVDRILDAPVGVRVRTDASALTTSLRRVAVALDERQPVVLQRLADRLLVSTPDDTTMAAAESIACSNPDEPASGPAAPPLRIALNPGYLISALSVVDDGHVELAVATSGHGCLLTSVRPDSDDAPTRPGTSHRHAFGLMRLPPDRR